MLQLLLLGAMSRVIMLSSRSLDDLGGMIRSLTLWVLLDSIFSFETVAMIRAIVILSFVFLEV